MSHLYLPWELFPDWDNDDTVCDHGFNRMSVATGDEEFKVKSCYQLQPAAMSSSYVKPICKTRTDNECARWFPYFAALSVIQSEGACCKGTRVMLNDFPSNYCSEELFMQARDVIQGSKACDHPGLSCIPYVIFHWRDEEAVKSYGPIPHASECKVSHEERFKISTHVFVCTLEESINNVKSFGKMKHSRILFSVAEGPRTKTLGFVCNERLKGRYDVSRDLTIGRVNWFDTRLRTCRLSQEKCRDCYLASTICRMR